jgi:predicted acetyltransferase
VIANPLQPNLHDFSEFEPRELSAPTFDYAWLDHYFTAPDQEAHLITVAGRTASFAPV